LTIARLVADGLDLKLYDDHALQEEAVRMGIRTKELKGLDEKAPGLFDRLFSQEPRVYLDLLEAAVYEVAKQGQAVILGHGSQILLRSFECALHVRIHASEQFRVKHLMDQQGLNYESAMKLIRKRDHEQRGFLRFAFHMDWNDLSLYDLVINCEKLGTDLAAKLIMEPARTQIIEECSMTVIDATERLSLSKKIEAAILEEDLNFGNSHIEVPEKGLVHITGWTYAEETKDRIHRIVESVPGVSEVRSEIVVVPITTL
jgi:cytidylate kinase